MITSLSLFHASAFFKSQLFLLPVLYLFYLSNGLTLADYFLFQGLIVLLNVFLQIPMGYLGDKFARKTLLITSYILFLGRIIFWYFFQGYWIVFLGELLYACSKGMFDAIESPYIYDLLEKRGKTHKMVRAYSKLNCALSSGTALAAILGSWMYDKLGLHLLLLTEFIFISCAILFVAKLPKTDLALNQNNGKNAFEHIKSAFKGVFLVFQKSNFRFFVLFSACLNACSHFFFWSFQPLMKLTLVPIALFGTVLFVNNVMRSVCALYTEK